MGMAVPTYVVLSVFFMREGLILGDKIDSTPVY